jgi:chromosome segregation ATPase
MTGQAAALFNRVHFESGVLRKEQIDPFGSTVRYNEQTRTFTPISADETRSDNARHAAMQDVKQFRELYADIKTDQALTPDHQTQLFTKLIAMIEDRLDQIKASGLQSTISTTPSPGVAEKSPTDTALTKLEKTLGDTETVLGKAQEQLQNTQNTLSKAEELVAEIITKLNEAKTALASQTPPTDEAKQKVDALTNELTAAKQSLSEAKTNRDSANERVKTLTTESARIKTMIKSAHQSLTSAKHDSTKSLTTLKTKVEALLMELGVATTTPPDNSRTEDCSGKPSETKYYLLGPEGAKQLDPNDRLLLALSVDSKPLISALQQVSERKIPAGGSNMKAVEEILEERGRILDARTLLLRAQTEAGQTSGLNEQSKLRGLLEELRKPYASTIGNSSPR